MHMMWIRQVLTLTPAPRVSTRNRAQKGLQEPNHGAARSTTKQTRPPASVCATDPPHG